MQRARSSAGPLRLVWVAITLFAFVYAHGVSMEGISGHVDRAAVSASAGNDRQAAHQEPMDHHGGRHSSHAAQECVPGQPEQTPVPAAPSACALIEQGTPDPGRSGDFGDAASARPLPSTAIRATVLQI